MIKLANKIALASLLGAEEWMEKSAAMLALPAGLGALAGGLTGYTQRNADSTAMWPVDDANQDLKPMLGAISGAIPGAVGGQVGTMAGVKAYAKLFDISTKIKNKKARAILNLLGRTAPLAGLLGGSTGAGALSGLGISKLIDL